MVPATLMQRDPKIPAAAAIGLGAFMCGGSIFGLVIVGLQRLTLSSAPPDFQEVMLTMHRVFLLHLPAGAVLGAMLSWQGGRLRRSLPGAAQSVAALLLVGMIVLGPYAVSSLSVVPVFERLFVKQAPPPLIAFQTSMDASMPVFMGVVCVLVWGALGSLAVLAWRARVEATAGATR